MPRSPFAGCAIFLIGAIILCFTLGVGAYSLFQQNKIIASFTIAEKKAVPVLDAPTLAASAPALIERLQRFQQQLSDSQIGTVELKLSAQDLNTAIAHFESLRDYRGQLWITAIDDGLIHADFCRTVNGLPGSGTLRHFHGQMTLRPQIVDQQIQFKVTHIRAATGQVPEEFIAQFPPYVLFENDALNPGLSTLLGKLNHLAVADDSLIARREPVWHSSKEAIDNGVRRLLRLLAGGFITIAGLAVFIGLLAKKKKERLKQAQLDANTSHK